MFAKVIAEKTVKGEEVTWKLKAFQNILPEKELPREYLTEEPNFRPSRDNKNGIVFRLSSKHLSAPFWGCYYTGEVLNDCQFSEMLTWMRRSGERLAKINKKLKEQPKTEIVEFEI